MPWLRIIALMAPHGFAPSEVRAWSFRQYREIVLALNEANAPPEGGAPPRPDFDQQVAEWKQFKSDWRAQQDAK